MFPRNNADVTHREKTVFYFQNKAVYRAEDRPTDICLKMAFTSMSIKDLDQYSITAKVNIHREQ